MEAEGIRLQWKACSLPLVYRKPTILLLQMHFYLVLFQSKEKRIIPVLLPPGFAEGI